VEKFTKEQIDNWRDFEDIRLEGRFNMLTSQARQLSSMDKNEWAFCIKNYSELKQAAIHKATE